MKAWLLMGFMIALFVQALRYRNEEVSDSLYLAQTDGMHQELLFSEEETAALRQWSEIEIDLIRTEVRANPEGWLPEDILVLVEA